MIRHAAITIALVVIAAPVAAQQVGNYDFTYADGILVTSADIVTCPYHFIQPITVNVTTDYNADTRSNIFGKFRTAAKKLNADAVILVMKGGKHMTAWAWTRREYTGNAIRYVDRSCAPIR